jgi:hypothetical protein
MVALAAFVTLGMFLLRKRRESRSSYVMSASKRHPRRLPSVDLDHEANRYSHVPAIYPFPYQTDSVNHLAPPIQPGTQSHHTNMSTVSYAASDPLAPFSHSRQNSNNDSFVGYGETGASMSSAGRRKAAMAGQTAYKNPTRFILHTDVEDALPDDDGVVELPPQYSEHRQPIAQQSQPVQRPISSHSNYSGPSELAYASSAFVPSSSQSQSHPRSSSPS